jgi:hypothetical protein
VSEIVNGNPKFKYDLKTRRIDFKKEISRKKYLVHKNQGSFKDIIDFIEGRLSGALSSHLLLSETQIVVPELVTVIRTQQKC